MPEFRMVADMLFEAEDLDDAFKKLRQHFEMLENSGEDKEDDEEDPLSFVGNIVLALKDDGEINWKTREVTP